MDFKKFLQFAKPVGIAMGVGGVFAVLWCLQQVNVNALGKKIILLEQKIGLMSSVDEKVKLEKDILVVEKDKTTLQNGIYTTLVQAAGGLILSLTAYVGWRNFKVAEDKQVTERFSKGIEHLGSDKIDIRLGGIYALEQIANDSPKYHWTIVEILSAFVREKCLIIELALESEVQSDSSKQTPDNITEKIQADVQAALTVISRRKSEQDPEGKRIDLRRVNLVGLEIQNAKFSYIDFRFSDLSNAKLWGADLSNAFLDSVNFYKAILVEADLSRASISGNPDANGQVLFANFSEAQLISADFSHSDLCGANLSSTMLHGANFSNCQLNQIILKNALLNGIKFNNKVLDGANFTDANLSMTNLMNIDFQNSNLTRTNISGSALYHADLSKSINLTREQIDSALTGNTTLPDHLNSPMES
jgi:uncharacterized protein YjbI with pentapeptide repeats